MLDNPAKYPGKDDIGPFREYTAQHTPQGCASMPQQHSSPLASAAYACPAPCLPSAAAGATGGFAGGEKGLKQFVATGEVTLRQPGQPGSRQTSPVAIAGLLVAAGAGGGLLLNEVTDLGETAVKAEIVNVS